MTPNKSKTLPSADYSGALLVTGAALLFSAKAVFVKLAYQYHIDTVTLMTLRMLFSFPVYLALALYCLQKMGPGTLSPARLLQVAVLGLAGYYAASFLDLSGLQYITANLERLILYLYPSLVMLISAVFLGRTIQSGELLCLGAAYIGIAVVFGTDLSLYSAESVIVADRIELPTVVWGSLLVFGSSITFAFYLVGSERLMNVMSPMLFTSLAMLTSTLGIALHFGLSQPIDKLLDQPAAVYGLAFATAIFSTVLPSYMMAEGIRRISAARASIIGSVGPVSTMVLGFVLLDEIITVWHMLGLSIVVASSLALSRMRPHSP